MHSGAVVELEKALIGVLLAVGAVDVGGAEANVKVVFEAKEELPALPLLRFRRRPADPSDDIALDLVETHRTHDDVPVNVALRVKRAEDEDADGRVELQLGAGLYR